MSQIGKLLRGLGWHNFRNLDGVYHKDISDDPHKMEELNYYLEFLKGKDSKVVHKIFMDYKMIDLSNPVHKEAKMKLVAEKLDELTKSKGKK